MTYRVVFSEAAAQDLEQLFDFALQRELDSETGDLGIADRAVQSIKDGIAFLTSSPFACSKAGSSSFVRELIIPFGHTGYVALFEVVDSNTVIIGAIRHQREDDYH
jgi:plasmid stabilization system protein ParE